MPRVGFEPTISTAKRWKTERFRPRCHCEWHVFHFLLPYFFRRFTFRLEPQHRTTFSRPVTYIETRHKNHLLCTSVSFHGRFVTDLACNKEDGIYRCLSHDSHSAQLTRLLSSVIWIFRGHLLHSTHYGQGAGVETDLYLNLLSSQATGAGLVSSCNELN
jgi:hypothetical protein